jgi:hypothetical protein
VGVQWEAKGRPQAVFDVAYRPEAVVYAETRYTLPGAQREELFRSRPIQLLPGAGVHIPISIWPRIIINFSKRADIEDEMLFVRGQYSIQNVSWAPYSAGPDGMVIPLPKGFRGGKIADEHQSIASISPGEGIRVVRPVAPGRTQLRMGYTLVSEGGELEWDLEVRQDMLQSGMEIRLAGDMQVKPINKDLSRRSLQGRTATANDGSQWFVFDDISKRAGDRMQLKISGMPAPPEWRVWLPRMIGLLVVALMVAGVVFALIRKPVRAAATGDKRRQALLDELVELERSGNDPARREQVISDLESLWRD